MTNNSQKEILALEIKKYPLLYDKNDTDYKNSFDWPSMGESCWCIENRRLVSPSCKL